MTAPMSDARFAEIRRLVAGGVMGTRDLAELLVEVERLRASRCSCDGDPIECSHEAARGHAEQTLAQYKHDAESLQTLYRELVVHNGIGWHRATELARLIDEVAIPSLRYCEDKYGHDDMARLNLEAGATETLCFGLSDEEAANLRQIRAEGPPPRVLDDSAPVVSGSPS